MDLKDELLAQGQINQATHHSYVVCHWMYYFFLVCFMLGVLFFSSTMKNKKG